MWGRLDADSDTSRNGRRCGCVIRFHNDMSHQLCSLLQVALLRDVSFPLGGMLFNSKPTGSAASRLVAALQNLLFTTLCLSV